MILEIESTNPNNLNPCWRSRRLLSGVLLAHVVAVHRTSFGLLLNPRSRRLNRFQIPRLLLPPHRQRKGGKVKSGLCSLRRLLPIPKMKAPAGVEVWFLMRKKSRRAQRKEGRGQSRERNVEGKNEMLGRLPPFIEKLAHYPQTQSTYLHNCYHHPLLHLCCQLSSCSPNQLRRVMQTRQYPSNHEI